MSFETRRAAFRAFYEATPPVPFARLDLTAFNGPKFTPPELPSLAGLSAGQVITALQGAIWIRPSLYGVRGAKPFHLGASAPTLAGSGCIQQIFFPLGYDEVFVTPTVDAARALLHRKSVDGGGLRFLDAEDGFRVESDHPKFGQINVVTPALVLELVGA